MCLNHNFTIDYIASLTDYQIENLYRAPARERAKILAEEHEEFKADLDRSINRVVTNEVQKVVDKASNDWTVEKIKENPAAFKNWYFLTMTGFGIPYNDCCQMWNEQWAEFKKQQGVQ